MDDVETQTLLIWIIWNTQNPKLPKDEKTALTIAYMMLVWRQYLEWEKEFPI
jgi:hypothetical protein